MSILRIALQLVGWVTVVFMAVGVQQARAEPIQWRIEDGGNGHYYDLVMPEAVADSYTWASARAAAEGTTFLGAQGHLVTVTSGA